MHNDESADVVVIGGGAVGVCAAWYLAQAGRQVTLLERGTVGGACSYGNAGLVCPSFSMPLAAPGVVAKGLRWMFKSDSPFYIKPRLDPQLAGWLLRFIGSCRPRKSLAGLRVLLDLSKRSMQLHAELAAGDSSFGFHRNGILMLYQTAKGLDAAAREADLLRAADLRIEVLDAQSIGERVSCVNASAIAGGLVFADDAHLDPGAFVAGLAVRLTQIGVDVRPNVQVLGFERCAGRITGVATSAGRINASHLVIACGAWSAELARELRLRIPMQPAKGYSITIPRPPDFPELPVMLSEAKVAVTPMGAKLRFAGTLELAGFDSSIDTNRVAAIRRAASRYLTGIDLTDDRGETWSGLRPCTPDGLPVLGRSSRYANVTLATGHGMLGISLAPVSGQLVAGLICGDVADDAQELIAALSADRFALN
jgi:D-amino-acid dehydrogenase